MSNWLFLMLLYAFFGWMKKKQRDKAREKIDVADQDLIEETDEDNEQLNDAIDTILNEDTENIEKESVHHFVQSIKSGQTNVLNKIMDKNNPVQSAIIFKEIFDKPRSLRRKIR